MNIIIAALISMFAGIISEYFPKWARILIFTLSVFLLILDEFALAGKL